MKKKKFQYKINVQELFNETLVEYFDTTEVPKNIDNESMNEIINLLLIKYGNESSKNMSLAINDMLQYTKMEFKKKAKKMEKDSKENTIRLIKMDAYLRGFKSVQKIIERPLLRQ